MNRPKIAAFRRWLLGAAMLRKTPTAAAKSRPAGVLMAS
jgi:hypothetical protein